jgi:microcystin-dependent protein
MKKITLLTLIATFTSALSFAQTGRVGIGTSTPEQKLDVAGNAKASDKVIATRGFVAGSVTTDTAKAVFATDITNKGFYIPRLNTSQKGTLGATLNSSNKGLLVFDTDLNRTDFWDGTAWKAVGDGAGGPPSGTAGGDLTGTYPNPNIANNAVTGNKILDGTITSADLATPAVNATNQIFNTLPVANGGTGVNTVTGAIIGNGSSAVSGVAASAGNQVLRRNNANTAYEFAQVQYSDVAGTPSALPPSGAAGGDLTGTYPDPAIANDAVTNTKLSNMAQNTIKGRYSSGSGDPEDLTATQVRTILNVADGANNYSHPTQTAIDVNATDNGTNIIDRVQVNTSGHVTAVSVRDLSTATTSAAGVMSAADKTKLDGIAAGANTGTVTNVATGTGLAGGPITTTGTISIANGGVGTTQLADNAVTTAKVANNAITIAKLPSGASGTTFLRGDGTWQKLSSEAYSIPQTAATAQWVKLGTLTIAQQGRSAYFKIITNNGYNALNSQNSEVFLRFKTSNGSGTFGGDASYWYSGANAHFSTSGNIKIVANAAGGAATAFDILVFLPTFTGDGSFYTVETTVGSWVHSGATGQTDPGAASSTVLIPELQQPSPKGIIVMWSGSISSIPSGWILCNGANGTPDLRDRFVVGAGTTYAVGATGGANTVALTTAQIPAHTHGYRDRFYAEGSSYTNNDILSEYHSTTQNFRGSGDTDTDNEYFSYVNKTTESTGSGTAHENRPPYYALCYIMKQ